MINNQIVFLNKYLSQKVNSPNDLSTQLTEIQETTNEVDKYYSIPSFILPEDFWNSDNAKNELLMYLNKLLLKN